VTLHTIVLFARLLNINIGRLVMVLFQCNFKQKKLRLH